jgi:hypothetical protein
MLSLKGLLDNNLLRLILAVTAISVRSESKYQAQNGLISGGLKLYLQLLIFIKIICLDFRVTTPQCMVSPLSEQELSSQWSLWSVSFTQPTFNFKVTFILAFSNNHERISWILNLISSFLAFFHCLTLSQYRTHLKCILSIPLYF